MTGSPLGSQPPRLSDLTNTAVLTAIPAAKKSMHSGPALHRHWDVVEQIDALVPDVRDAPGALQAVTGIRLTLRAAGRDRGPGHADGVASNIMLHPDDGVRPVDFDCTGMADPHYDIGMVLNEIYALDAEWHAGVEMAFGRDTPGDFNRRRAFAIAPACSASPASA